MTTVPDFYSKREINKPVNKRVYHNDSGCPPGIDIKSNKDNEPGRNGYRLCSNCEQRNKEGK